MIRKVLLATLNYDHPQTGQITAFQSVFGTGNVVDFDYLTLAKSRSIDIVNEMFVETCVQEKPDWVWMQLQETDTIKATALQEAKRLLPKTIFTHWTGDYRPRVSPYMASICRNTDITFASSVGQLSAFLEAGAPRAKYLQIGLDWNEDALGLPEWAPPFKVPDVVFCGGYYQSSFPTGTKDRVDVIQALIDAKLNVGIVGSGWPSTFPVIGSCTVKQQHHVWKRAKAAINVNNENKTHLYYSDRLLIAMASGTPVVTILVPGLQSEFTHGEDLMMFHSPAEAAKQVQWLLDNPRIAAQIGRQGRSKVLQSHTWHNRVIQALLEVESLST